MPITPSSLTKKRKERLQGNWTHSLHIFAVVDCPYRLYCALYLRIWAPLSADGYKIGVKHNSACHHFTWIPKLVGGEIYTCFVSTESQTVWPLWGRPGHLAARVQFRSKANTHRGAPATLGYLGAVFLQLCVPAKSRRVLTWTGHIESAQWVKTASRGWTTGVVSRQDTTPGHCGHSSWCLIYLTTLSVADMTHNIMTGRLMNNKLERTWKGVGVT
jgi:hypothetical protein